MTERWQRLKALFQGALDQPAADRLRWLRDAAGDADLLHEAEALLHSHETAGDFLEEAPSIDPGELAGALATGTRIGPYAILDEIGRGGMGIVYLAEDIRLGRRLALKSLPPSVAGDPALRERLRREARAAATISHPGVAIVYALEELDEHLLLATEYVPGQTLRHRIGSGGLTPALAVDIVTDIVRALAAAHDAGVIHRDLKPENVIVTHTGSIKVVDFGIAYFEAAGLTRQTVDGAMIGTPAYMAPEQLAGARGDARVDIYSVGVVLAELLTGRHPLDPDYRSDSLPPHLAAIIARCLARDPADRYESARELLRALQGGSQSRSSARWWWEFHQGAAALVYWLLVIPAWMARGLIGGAAGRIFFIATLAAVIVAANLRLHFWFTSRFYPQELPWLRDRVARWIQVADWVFAAALVTGAVWLGDAGAPLGIVLMSFGLGAAVVFLFIEPATTRAAFGSARQR